MNKKSEKVRRWRHRFKQRVVDSMGGKCQICGYDRCNAALELHHLNPSEKELSLGSLSASPKGWKEHAVPELRKCILLCSCCHREFHSGYVELPDTFARFDESYLDYMYSNDLTSACPVCSKQKPNLEKFCSYLCSSKAANRNNWDTVDLEKFIKDGKSYAEISKILNFSSESIRRRAKKLGISIQQKVVNWPSSEELEKLVWEKPLTQIAKDLNVSNVSVKKRCMKLKIKTPPVGHWNRNNC
jgi:hypothetical protein